MESLDWKPKDVTIEDDVISFDKDLRIMFQRTVRVPDNGGDHALPPGMGKFPLLRVADYAHQLPAAMAKKGGLFLPVHQREALWINFGAWNNYAIKIYAGGVNVVSGEAADETDEIRKRRLERVKKKESIQDFVIAPDQCWIDGIATEPGKVRQFVAMPMGAGYSIESQVKGEEVTGGLQFEITRIKRKRPPPTMTIFVKLYNGLQRTEPFLVDPGTYYGQDLIDMIGEQIFPVGARDILMLGGRAIKKELTLAANGIREHCTVIFSPSLRGGGVSLQPELTVAAGGRIKQNIEPMLPGTYLKSATVTFNVQLLNSAHYFHVTGQPPPSSPISAETYAALGLPFFAMYEEPPLVAGDFGAVRSVAQLEGRREATPLQRILTIFGRRPAEVWDCEACGARNVVVYGACRNCWVSRPAPPYSDGATHGDDNPPPYDGAVGFFNPAGPMGELRFEREIVEELEQLGLGP